jgi:hypothetical protein
MNRIVLVVIFIASVMLPLVVSALGQSSSAVKNASAAQKPWTPPRTADGQPDIQGIWSNASIIPLERPKELEGKQFFTRQELEAYEDRVFARTIRDKPPAPGSVGTYNDFWWDRDSKRALNLRTSLIVDPPDGKVPPFTPEAQKRVDAERAYARAHPADGPEDRLLAERCIIFPMAVRRCFPAFTTTPSMVPSRRIIRSCKHRGTSRFSWKSCMMRASFLSMGVRICVPLSVSGWVIRAAVGKATRSLSTRQISRTRASSEVPMKICI